jgi:hypothetical protein
MKVIYTTILMICFFHQFMFGQPKVSHKRVKMIEFLIKNGELDTFNHDGLLMYNTVVNERVVYKKQSCTISIFGIFSAHSGKYIALVYSSHIILLQADNMATEMDTILLFLKKQNIDKPNLIKVLSDITAAYQYNIELKKKLVLQRPPAPPG